MPETKQVVAGKDDTGGDLLAHEAGHLGDTVPLWVVKYTPLWVVRYAPLWVVRYPPLWVINTHRYG